MYAWLQCIELSHNYTEYITSEVEGRWKDIFYYLSSGIILKIQGKKWIWETLKQLFDKYLLNEMKSKTDLMDAMKWELKPIKSSNYILKAAKIYLLSGCISVEDI